jgi:dienelactone hydrolase
MEVEIKRILISAGAILLVSGIVAVICIAHFVGFPKTVSDNKTKYTTHEIHVQHDEIDLFGVALAPEGNGPFPTVIYAHGAESDYRSDMTTLKSLAMSGIACYTFDFYGWSTRSSGPQAGNWFKNQPRGVDDRYEKQVIEQVKDLDAVIEKVKTLNFVDPGSIFLLGSSMGGAAVAAASVTHSYDDQPHVFTGKYKVDAAREIYSFIWEELAK